jgi:hypothetical protein
MTSLKNSTYMKKGSFTSKLMSSFFMKSRYTSLRQGCLLYYAWIHYYCRSMPRGGGCIATVAIPNRK